MISFTMGEVLIIGLVVVVILLAVYKSRGK
jgi:Tfp pilus assembly protein PilV